MAIIKSAAVGNATGSLGNITYQVVKGRTIGKQKVNPGKATRYNATETQHMQRARMAVVGHFAKLVQRDIKKNFRETLTGWEQNGFMKTNFIVLSVAFDEAVQAVYSKEASARSLSFDYLNNMIKAFVASNPETIVYSDNGSTVVFVSPEGWPTPPLPMSIDDIKDYNPPMGTPTSITSLPFTIEATHVHLFSGVNLSPTRVRYTINGNKIILGNSSDVQIATVSASTSVYFDAKLNAGAAGSLTLIEYLDENGEWQTYLSTSVLSRYKQQMRNVRQKQQEQKAAEEKQMPDPVYNAF